MAKPSQKEIRQAHAFLAKWGFTSSMIPPKMFAAKAKETGLDFRSLLQMIASYKLGGQGMGQTPIAESYDSQDARSGLELL